MSTQVSLSWSWTVQTCSLNTKTSLQPSRNSITIGWRTKLILELYGRFPVGNAEYVKQFLLQYSLLRRKEGFVLRHDSLASLATGGIGLGMTSERVMNASAGCLPKQMGVLPDVLCTSSGECPFLRCLPRFFWVITSQCDHPCWIFVLRGRAWLCGHHFPWPNVLLLVLCAIL